MTWGVFPRREMCSRRLSIAQLFVSWRDEAFALWKTQWADLYPAESASRAPLQQIHDTYYLVSIVDNDFMNREHIFAIFDEVIAAMDGPAAAAAGSLSSTLIA